MFTRDGIYSILLVCISIASAAKPANYSVQLMEGLAPAGWSAKQWAAAADTMVGKTQAYILTDLIENLGIKLKITETDIRNQIDLDRAKLGLNALPPPTEKKGVFDLMKKRYHRVDQASHEDDLSTYLPPGWTEEKLKTHSVEEAVALPPDEKERLALRLRRDIEEEKSSPNKGFLEELPDRVGRNISNSIHEIGRKAHGLAPGVRLYKRNAAPLVAIVDLQNYDHFGFILYRTSYKNDTAWDGFMEVLEGINDAQMGSDWNGEGMENILDRFMMPIENNAELESASAEDCRARFRELRAQDAIPYGLDIGLLLMADEKSIQSLADLNIEDNPAHVWAVDVGFDPKGNIYPAGYEGRFEVRTHALLHHLYVAVGSGMLAPVDVWKLLQRSSIPDAESEEKSHDEL